MISHFPLLLLTLISEIKLFITYNKTYEESAKQFLELLNRNKTEYFSNLTLADWNYSTDLTEANKKFLMDANARAEEIDYAFWQEVIKYNVSLINDPSTKRQLQKLAILGSAALGPKDSSRMTEITADMEKIYSSAKVCVGTKCDLSLEPHLVEIMARERDYELLKEAWVNWREETGNKMRTLYTEYVSLGNQMAVKTSYGNKVFKNLGDLWLEPYEDYHFKDKMSNLWNELDQFYKELHAFVRMMLRNKYENLPTDGTIPAHLLGNMWAQNWVNIMDDVSPFPDLPPLDVTNEMNRKGLNSRKMFRMAERFFVSLGLEPMTAEFWNNSMFVKPENREVVCHASAWDMSTGSDFRIKLCTEITMDNLISIHHEMGHIVYYMLYKDQPLVFREGANPAFHEAFGELIALSVSTPKYLRKLGLLEGYRDDIRGILNHQLLTALDKVAFLPFGYLIDLWRWDVFAKRTKPEEYNRKWWELRLKYQGISPPVPRSESDFDPGSKYHIPSSAPYIGYFVSNIIQFQLHKYFCELTNQTELYSCDISNYRQVGYKLRNVLSQGSSVQWQMQLKQLIDEDMSAQALLEYFTPLRSFLKEVLKDETIGWKYDYNDYMLQTKSGSFIVRNYTTNVTFILWILWVILLLHNIHTNSMYLLCNN